MTDRGAEPPSPFSREGSRASDGLGADQEPTGSSAPGSDPGATPPAPSWSGSSDEVWPTYPDSGSVPPADPFTPPPADPYAAPYVDPGFDPQPTPPYAGYGGSRPYEVNPAAAYGTNPYEVSPYPPGYGYGPYGMIPTQHPRAVPAMVLGIVGIVLAGSCGIGGFVGIGGIVLGRKARDEIDAQPGRYAGRSQAVAGFVMGIIGTVLGALITVLFIVLFAVGVGLEEF